MTRLNFTKDLPKYMKDLHRKKSLFFLWGLVPDDIACQISPEGLDFMMKEIIKTAEKLDIALECIEDEKPVVDGIHFCLLIESQKRPFFPLTEDDDRVKQLRWLCQEMIEFFKFGYEEIYTKFKEVAENETNDLKALVSGGDPDLIAYIKKYIKH